MKWDPHCCYCYQWINMLVLGYSYWRNLGQGNFRSSQTWDLHLQYLDSFFFFNLRWLKQNYGMVMMAVAALEEDESAATDESLTEFVGLWKWKENEKNFSEWDGDYIRVKEVQLAVNYRLKMHEVVSVGIFEKTWLFDFGFTNKTPFQFFLTGTRFQIEFENFQANKLFCVKIK